MEMKDLEKIGNECMRPTERQRQKWANTRINVEFICEWKWGIHVKKRQQNDVEIN